MQLLNLTKLFVMMFFMKAKEKIIFLSIKALKAEKHFKSNPKDMDALKKKATMLAHRDKILNRIKDKKKIVNYLQKNGLFNV